jgi:hypothetical protein
MAEELMISTDTGRLPEPADVRQDLDRAGKIAGELMRTVREKGLSVTLGQSEHLKVEAWLTLAGWFRLSAVPGEVLALEREGRAIGYRCRTELRDAEGRVVGAGEGICMIGEEQRKRDGTIVRKFSADHEAAGMAQTRSISRAIANKLRMIPVLAGISGTPAEEVPEGGYPRDAAAATGKPGNGGSKAKTHKPTEPGSIRAKIRDVKDIKTKTGRTMFAVVTAEGMEVTTFDADLAAAARQAVETDAAVDIGWAINGQYANLTSVELAAD